MSLTEALSRFGYSFRQHLDEEGWGWRKLTVVDLDAAQRDALSRGGVAGLRDAMRAQNRWTFPAMDITSPLPRSADVTLSQGPAASAAVVVPAGNAPLRSLAEQLIEAIARRAGVRLPLIDDDAEPLELLQTRSLIVLGGSHENRLALKLALRTRTCFVDASVPGEGGWIVTTLTGLNAEGRNVLQVSAAPEHHAAAVACITEQLARQGDTWAVRHIHRIEQGPALKSRFPTWEAFTTRLTRMVTQFQSMSVLPPADPVALSHLLAVGLQSGGQDKNYYNIAPVDIAILCARHHQLSADPRSLILFRELLFRLADYYLKTPEGASYPADIDFRIGTLLLHYARFEHHPIFSDDDRLVLTNLFLSCIRAVHEYAATQWKIDPDATTRFNHQTFKALSQEFGADYFARYGIRDVAAWRDYAARVFIDPLWQRSKQTENANVYELLVFDHAAAWWLFTGRPWPKNATECLRKVVRRQIISTDNFLKPVDYGDSGLKMKPECAGMARLASALDRDTDAAIRWFAEEDLARHGDDLPVFLHEHPGLRRRHTATAPKAGDWERAPLEPGFLADFAPQLPQKYAYDKLAFRTGWGEQDHYLLWEGVGNLKVSHSHNEANGIVRLNHLGRHWIVSNGYGRRAGVTNVGLSFSTRVRGPEDHNMLVLRRNGDIVRDLPACAAALQQAQQGPLLMATAALPAYGGVDWFRTLLIHSGAYVLVIDRVRINDDGLEAGHVEWNALGTCQPAERGFRLEQQGVFMHIASDGSWPAEQQAADQSACWKAALGSAYPYATFPLVKLVYKFPDTRPGSTHTLATLLAASHNQSPQYTLARASDGKLRVVGKHDRCAGTHLHDSDFHATSDNHGCDVSFDAVPGVGIQP